MPYNLLIIPLIAGYYILSNLVFFKFKYQRLQSQRLVLNSALFGLFIAVCTLCLRYLVEHHFTGLFHMISGLFGQFLTLSQPSTRYLWTMFCGLMIAVSFTEIINLIVNKSFRFKNYVVGRAVDLFGNELEILFKNSVKYGWPIQITLKNDKVYLGYIDSTPLPSKTNYFDLMPLYSGYRDPVTKELQFTTSYETVHDLLELSGQENKIGMMIVVIKQDEVLSASPHDHDVYSRFQGVDPEA